MKYRVKGIDTVVVLEMDDAGTVTWQAGDFLAFDPVRNRVTVMPQSLFSFFCEKVPEATNGAVTAMPATIAAPENVVMPAIRKYTRQAGVSRAHTNWTLPDCKWRLQRRQGRVLLAIARKIDQRASVDGPASLPRDAIPFLLDKGDRLAWSGRVTELVSRGMLDRVTNPATGHHELAITPLGRRFLQAWGDAIAKSDPD